MIRGSGHRNVWMGHFKLMRENKWSHWHVEMECVAASVSLFVSRSDQRSDVTVTPALYRRSADDDRKWRRSADVCRQLTSVLFLRNSLR